MIEGLSHVTFVVRDLRRAKEFLEDVLGAEEVYCSGDETFSVSREKFFVVGGVWIAVMEGEPRAGRTYDHVAFKIPEEEYDPYSERVRAAGVELREGRRRAEGEGRSLYFYDHDGHLFELHTGTLKERLDRYGRAG